MPSSTAFGARAVACFGSPWESYSTSSIVVAGLVALYSSMASLAPLRMLMPSALFGPVRSPMKPILTDVAASPPPLPPPLLPQAAAPSATTATAATVARRRVEVLFTFSSFAAGVPRLFAAQRRRQVPPTMFLWRGH